ncbi:MAG: DUF4079 domain-containing protein [Cyanobacteria bacterium P01_A01_bin.83]
MNIDIWTLIEPQKYLAFTHLGNQDLVALIHPALVVAFVFPMVGIVTYFAWQTRQRRLQSKDGKSKIPPIVGREHVRVGRWLATSVVVVSLIAIAYSIVYKSFIKGNLWTKNNPKAILILLLFAATIASLVLLLQAKPKLWRGIFATMTGMGLIILGQQDGVWRLPDEWYWSHYYYGIAVSLLMILSIAIVDDIYRNLAIRNLHIIVNCLALLLFIGQGVTGARDLLEIPPVGKKKAKKAAVEMVTPIKTAQFNDQEILQAPQISPQQP